VLTVDGKGEVMRPEDLREVQNGTRHVRQIRTGSIGRGNRRQSRRYVPELRWTFLMIAGVADTHTALWHLFDDKRLSAAIEA
jgi:hypothetical protein